MLGRKTGYCCWSDLGAASPHLHVQVITQHEVLHVAYANVITSLKSHVDWLR